MRAASSSLLTTIQGLMFGSETRGPSVEDRLDLLRQRMLDSLGGTDGLQMSALQRRVLFAPDAESLWYLRPEVLMNISAVRGERMARQLVDDISIGFDGLLPGGLMARRSRQRQPGLQPGEAITPP